MILAVLRSAENTIKTPTVSALKSTAEDRDFTATPLHPATLFCEARSSRYEPVSQCIEYLRLSIPMPPSSLAHTSTPGKQTGLQPTAAAAHRCTSSMSALSLLTPKKWSCTQVGVSHVRPKTSSSHPCITSLESRRLVATLPRELVQDS